MSQAAKQRDEITRLGFWLYILSDVMIFGVLFATFMVLRHNVAGGAGIEQIVIGLERVERGAIDNFVQCCGISQAGETKITDLSFITHSLKTFEYSRGAKDFARCHAEALVRLPADDNPGV